VGRETLERQKRFANSVRHRARTTGTMQKALPQHTRDDWLARLDLRD
jgi:crotonobetainyl-CoA:carnitine CoA-transferase CaiB-like acyl-CoA transferase